MPLICPVGSACGGGYGGEITEPVVGRRGGWGGHGGRLGCGGYNWLGSVTEIPLDRVVSFTHNAL